MTKTIVKTALAPVAQGPYSQAVSYGGLLFCSGQIPLDPATGKLVEGGAAEQTRRAMENLGAVLGAAGMDFSHVLKTTLYLQDMGDFAEVNQAYGAFFTGDFPARATLQAGRLPLGARIEIDAVAGR